jgi:iron(III) transport system substrate-binding protein
MTETTKNRSLLIGVATALLLMMGCRQESSEVVVYTSVDQVFSQPVLERFSEETGIEVLAVYDTEEAKSTGVVNRLIAEAENPQADVFWSGDVFRCLVLKEKEILVPHQAPPTIPEGFRDPEGMWTGFSARARVLAYDLERVGEPLAVSLRDFATEEWAGELAMANPLFGTTTVHVAALFVALGDEEAQSLFDALKEKGTRMVASNSESLRLALTGEVSYGLTDTDDAFVALENGEPLGLRFPDQEGAGTLFMPNAVARIRGGPNPAAAQRLIDFLLTPQVEAMLRDSAGQIPVLPGNDPPEGFGLGEVRFMEVDYEDVARKIEEIQPYLRSWAGL